ncbi:hypothetical protein FSP39_014177 [Pinctada imbricata]|uniref:Uncharacterized protein n=1 Tax=Pinctada imbricata TaxID=66713 RepID=A0AA88XFF3_PINIB|nr:hypothetical protein FSP39_014177 [Pinctada imbricata]
MLVKTGAKLFVTWIGPFNPIISLCHPDTAKLLFKSSEPKTIFKPPGYCFFIHWLGMGLLLSHGKKWERNRRLLTPAFHFDILKPYVKIYNSVADTFLKSLQRDMDSNKTVEIYSLVTLATLDTMLRCAFSYEDGLFTCRVISKHIISYIVYCSQFHILSSNPFLHSDWMFFLSRPGREWKKHTDYVHKFAEEIISSRRRSLDDDPHQLDKRYLDFLDILITAKDSDGSGLSDEDIRAEVDTFLFEGHDTTASAISWAMYYLGKYPDEQQKVYDEVRNLTNGEENFTWENINECQRLTLFLKEAMRMSSPVPAVSRQLTRPMVFDGIELPAGCPVGIWISHVNNHPDVWPDYQTFRPERFLENEAKARDPYAYVPFAAGPRNCIGQKFAFDEQKVIIARLVLRYKISLVPDFEYIQDIALITRAKYGIKLRMEDRNQ